MSSPAAKRDSVLLEFVARAVEVGADGLVVEYKDGHEQVYAFHGNIGYGIARLTSESPEAKQLREELWGLRRKRKRVHVSGVEHVLEVEVFDSFGENAFRVSISTIQPGDPPDNRSRDRR